MKHWRKRILIFAVLLLGFAFLVWAFGPKQQGPKISITFAGFTNNPVRGVTPTGRVEVCAGATGTCALFFVRNVTTNQYLWFNTASVQLEEEQGWRTFEPIGGVWSGVEGSLWSPSYGCLYAVGCPPGLPTNASWRLQVRYGKDPSLFGIVVNQRLGHQIFRSGKEESVVPSDVVEPTNSPRGLRVTAVSNNSSASRKESTLGRVLSHLFSPKTGVLLLVLFFLSVALSFRRTAKGQFEYYVLYPMPPSVRDVMFEGDDLRINPEPLCFIRFSASSADIEAIIQGRSFKEANDSFNPTGPPWWNVSTLTNVRVLVRQHGPKRKTKLYFGKNRRWTEMLRIDSTGTNAYFLVWGI